MSRIPLLLLVQDAALKDYWSRAFAAEAVMPLSSLPAPDSLPEGAVLLVDLGLPALPACSDPVWSSLARKAKLVVASTHPCDPEGLVWMQAGAVGYCHAYGAAPTLQQVVSVVAAGGLWVGESLLGRMLAGVSRALQASQAQVLPDVLARLSEREGEVAVAAARGDSNKAIAGRLGITERTVKAHMSAIFSKLGVSDRLQLSLRLNGLG